MNVVVNGRTMYVTLSRFNLVQLLAELDNPPRPRHDPPTLYRVCKDGILFVAAEQDDVHYGDREPGPGFER